MTTLKEFLKKIKLEKYYQKFEEEEIDLEAAMELEVAHALPPSSSCLFIVTVLSVNTDRQEDDLKELKIPMGARKKFMKNKSMIM